MIALSHHLIEEPAQLRPSVTHLYLDVTLQFRIVQGSKIDALLSSQSIESADVVQHLLTLKKLFHREQILRALGQSEPRADYSKGCAAETNYEERVDIFIYHAEVGRQYDGWEYLKREIHSAAKDLGMLR